jgi:solute carrier family 35 protein E1
MTLNLLIFSLTFIKIPHITNINPLLYKNKINNDKLNYYKKSISNITKKNTINIINSFKYIPCDYDNNEKCFAYCHEHSEEECKIIFKKDKFDSFKTIFYIIVWFVLSAKYNITNKQRLNMLNLPWFQSVGSLGSGSILVLLLWKTKLRFAPKLNFKEIKTYLPIAFFHSIGHITAVISMSAGAVSFTQIVKAVEPIFTSGFNWLLLGDVITFPVGLSLFTIVLGVSFASVSELSFTWTSFISAMLSNVAFAGRNVFSRLSLDKPKGKNITPENLFGILTIMSFLISIPLAFIFEGYKLKNIFIDKSFSSTLLLKKTFETGLYFYLYNEASMVVLNKINPVSHAIINTLKRIVLLFVCILFFNTPLTRNGIIGSLIAITGSYFYSNAKKLKNK